MGSGQEGRPFDGGGGGRVANGIEHHGWGNSFGDLSWAIYEITQVTKEKEQHLGDEGEGEDEEVTVIELNYLRERVGM